MNYTPSEAFSRLWPRLRRSIDMVPQPVQLAVRDIALIANLEGIGPNTVRVDRQLYTLQSFLLSVFTELTSATPPLFHNTLIYKLFVSLNDAMGPEAPILFPTSRDPLTTLAKAVDDLMAACQAVFSNATNANNTTALLVVLAVLFLTTEVFQDILPMSAAVFNDQGGAVALEDLRSRLYLWTASKTIVTYASDHTVDMFPNGFYRQMQRFTNMASEIIRMHVGQYQAAAAMQESKDHWPEFDDSKAPRAAPAATHVRRRQKKKSTPKRKSAKSR